MLWSVFSASNEILVIQGFTTSFWCLLTKKQGPWGRFCSQILPWKLAARTLVRFFPKGDAAQLTWTLNLGTLSQLAYRLLRNSAKKEADSSSSHPERGCQTAEAAETTSNLITDRPRAKTAAFVALALVTVSAHQVLIIMTAAKSPHHSYRDPSTANKLLEEDRGSRTTQPQELGYHYLRRSLGQKPPGFQQDFTGFHMARCITHLHSLLAGHDKGFRTTTVLNNTLLFTAASLASPQCRRSKGEDCPKRGKHTEASVGSSSQSPSMQCDINLPSFNSNHGMLQGGMEEGGLQ